MFSSRCISFHYSTSTNMHLLRYQVTLRYVREWIYYDPELSLSPMMHVRWTWPTFRVWFRSSTAHRSNRPDQYLQWRTNFPAPLIRLPILALYVCDLAGGGGHSRSLKMAPLDRPYTVPPFPSRHHVCLCVELTLMTCVYLSVYLSVRLSIYHVHVSNPKW